MKDPSKSVTRRTLLQRAALLLAGAAGLKFAGQTSADQTGSDPLHKTLFYYCRRHPVQMPAQVTAMPGARSDRLVSCGILLEQPGGKKAGEFYSTCFCQPSPFNRNPLAASNLEFEHFNLNDGFLFGLGTGAAICEERSVRIILGGTGAYAGARGAYEIRRDCRSEPEFYTIQITLT